MDKAVKFYRLSGKNGDAGLLLTLGASLAVAVFGAMIYANLVEMIRFLYVRVFLTIGFGAALGLCVGWAAKIAKVRNGGSVKQMAIGSAVVALYFSWAFHVGIVMKSAGVQTGAVFAPGELWSLMKLFNENGTWALRGGTPVKGFVLTLVWLIEAAIVVGASVHFADKMLGSLFCERCEEWVDDINQSLGLKIDERTESIIDRGRAGDVLALREMDEAFGSEAEFLVVETAACRRCKTLNVLTLKRVVVGLDDKGEEQQTEEVILDKMLIEHDEMKQFLKPWGSEKLEVAVPEESPDIGDYGKVQEEIPEVVAKALAAETRATVGTGIAGPSQISTDLPGPAQFSTGIPGPALAAPAAPTLPVVVRGATAPPAAPAPAPAQAQAQAPPAAPAPAPAQQRQFNTDIPGPPPSPPAPAE